MQVYNVDSTFFFWIDFESHGKLFWERKFRSCENKHGLRKLAAVREVFKTALSDLACRLLSGCLKTENANQSLSSQAIVCPGRKGRRTANSRLIDAKMQEIFAMISQMILLKSKNFINFNFVLFKTRRNAVRPDSEVWFKGLIQRSDSGASPRFPLWTHHCHQVMSRHLWPLNSFERRALGNSYRFASHRVCGTHPVAPRTIDASPRRASWWSTFPIHILRFIFRFQRCTFADDKCFGSCFHGILGNSTIEFPSEFQSRFPPKNHFLGKPLQEPKTVEGIWCTKVAIIARSLF